MRRFTRRQSTQGRASETETGKSRFKGPAVCWKYTEIIVVPFCCCFYFLFWKLSNVTKEETIHQDFKTESKCTLDWRLKHFMLKMQKGFWALFCFLDYL